MPTATWNNTVIAEAKADEIEVDGERNGNAAWTYPSAKPAASNIEGFVAFWKGVEVQG